MSAMTAVDLAVTRLQALLKIPESMALQDDLPATFRSLAACLPNAIHFDVLCLILCDEDRVQILTRNAAGDIDSRGTNEYPLPGERQDNASCVLLVNRSDSQEWRCLQQVLRTDRINACMILPLIASRQNL